VPVAGPLGPELTPSSPSSTPSGVWPELVIAELVLAEFVFGELVFGEFVFGELVLGESAWECDESADELANEGSTATATVWPSMSSRVVTVLAASAPDDAAPTGSDDGASMEPGWAAA
jgi:hypothetical protein